MQKLKTALLIIDVQNDFCDQGTLAVPKANDVIPVINNLRTSLSFSVIYMVSDWHPIDHISFASNHAGRKPFETILLPNGKQETLWPNHCVQNQAGSYFHKDLIRKDNDIIIRKGKISDVNSYSGFGTSPEDSGLEKDLRSKGIQKIFVVGLALDFCVKDTALDGVDKGYCIYIY